MKWRLQITVTASMKGLFNFAYVLEYFYSMGVSVDVVKSKRV